MVTTTRFHVWAGDEELTWRVKQTRHFGEQREQVYGVHLTYYDDSLHVFDWECSCGVFKAVGRNSDDYLDCCHIRIVKRVANAHQVMTEWNMADNDPAMTLTGAMDALEDSELFVCSDCGRVLSKRGAAHMCGAYSKVMRKVGKTKVTYRIVSTPKTSALPVGKVVSAEPMLLAPRKRTVVIRPRRSDGSTTDL